MSRGATSSSRSGAGLSDSAAASRSAPQREGSRPGCVRAAEVGLQVKRRGPIRRSPLEATALMAEIHDRLRENGYEGHPLRVWLTRILFCLFAGDSGGS